MDKQGEESRSCSLLEPERRESWQSECSWGDEGSTWSSTLGDEGSTCLGLAIDGPWSSSKNPSFDSQSEISTEVRGFLFGFPNPFAHVR